MALKSFRDRNIIMVGLVSLTTLGLLVTVVFVTGTLGLLENRYTMTGVFVDTGGMRSGDDVQVAGVRVGEVTSVEPRFDRGDVVITWKVDHDVRLGAGTRAEIKMANILGGRFLRLSGPVAKPYMADLSTSRRRIPVERTETPVLVNEVLKNTTQAISKLDDKAIGKLLGQVNGLTERNRGRLGRSLRNLNALAETINENDPKIRQLLDDGDRILTVINSRDAQLARLLSSTQAMLNELRARQAELTTFLGSGSQVVRNLTGVIERHQAQLISTMKDLSGTLQALRPETANFNNALAWAGPTLTGLAAVGGRGPWADLVATGLGPLTPADLAQLAGKKQTGGTGTTGTGRTGGRR